LLAQLSRNHFAASSMLANFRPAMFSRWGKSFSAAGAGSGCAVSKAATSGLLIRAANVATASDSLERASRSVVLPICSRAVCAASQAPSHQAPPPACGSSPTARKGSPNRWSCPSALGSSARPPGPQPVQLHRKHSDLSHCPAPLCVPPRVMGFSPFSLRVASTFRCLGTSLFSIILYIRHNTNGLPTRVTLPLCAVLVGWLLRWTRRAGGGTLRQLRTPGVRGPYRPQALRARSLPPLPPAARGYTAGSKTRE